MFAAQHRFPLWKQNNEGDGIFVNTAGAAELIVAIWSLSDHVTKHAAVSIADSSVVKHFENRVSVHCRCPHVVRTVDIPQGIGEGYMKFWSEC